MKYKISFFLLKKKRASIVENMLVALIGFVMATAMLVIIFGAFKTINDRWMMQQTAREYMLLMETEGYLKPDDESALISDLEAAGLHAISLTGTTRSEVSYGEVITLSITGTYDQNILSFADGISKVAERPITVNIVRQSTAKQ